MGLVAPRQAGFSQESGIKPMSPWVGRQTLYHWATQGSPQAFYLSSALQWRILEFLQIHPLLILLMVSFDTHIKINAVRYVLHFLLQSLSFLSWLSLCYPCSVQMVFYFHFCQGFYLLFNSLGLNPSGTDLCDGWEVRVQTQIFPGREPAVVLSYLKLAILSH